ncbi:MAG TPA: hypothetical protein VFV86_02380 [Nitrososphaeraceae archaeon]|nr:hypothetical protein [Nitrososphaeraceae archaeon]
MKIISNSNFRKGTIVISSYYYRIFIKNLCIDRDDLELKKDFDKKFKILDVIYKKELMLYYITCYSPYFESTNSQQKYEVWINKDSISKIEKYENNSKKQ